MALSRRLFIGGLLASAAAPAIITSKGFKPAVPERILTGYPVFDAMAGFRRGELTIFGTDTGRMSCSEPAWQGFEEIDRRALPYQREAIKQILFAARYGTRESLFEAGRRQGKTLLALDFTEMETRMIAQRDLKDMFNALKGA